MLPAQAQRPSPSAPTTTPSSGRAVHRQRFGLGHHGVDGPAEHPPVHRVGQVVQPPAEGRRADEQLLGPAQDRAREVRFDIGLRGYRMDQVDTVLDRLVRELRSRDEELGTLRSGPDRPSRTHPLDQGNPAHHASPVHQANPVDHADPAVER